jgi:HAD domain in Swiss Army Knife RNA repair proteins
MRHPIFPMDRTAPTLFVDFDGTLHSGHAVLSADGQVSLDSGRPLFECAPLLVAMLEPYPSVQIVLTTSWLRTLSVEKVISHLPPALARRVVDTTQDVKARLSYILNGSERTYVIARYALGHGLKNWLAIDDSVYDAYHIGSEPGQLMQNFVLLDAGRGIRDEAAQQRIRDWLIDVHKDNSFG